MCINFIAMVYFAGSSLKSADQYVRPANLALRIKGNKSPSTQRRVLTVQASYRYIHSMTVALNPGKMNCYQGLCKLHHAPFTVKQFFLSIVNMLHVFWLLSANEEEPRSCVYSSHCE